MMQQRFVLCMSTSNSWSVTVTISGLLVFLNLIVGSTFRPQSARMRLLWISEQMFFISVYNVRLMALVPETGRVYCAVGTGVLNRHQ
jgi:hypothetical protein